MLSLKRETFFGHSTRICHPFLLEQLNSTKKRYVYTAADSIYKGTDWTSLDPFTHLSDVFEKLVHKYHRNIYLHSRSVTYWVFYSEIGSVFKTIKAMAKKIRCSN
jgi:hypothetical protein